MDCLSPVSYTHLDVYKRQGVSLGLPFPAGPALEKLGQEVEKLPAELTANSDKVIIKSAVKGYNMSFSGPETAARRLIRSGTAKPLIARAVEQCLATSLEKVLREAVYDTGLSDILLIGGVGANNYLRRRLRHRLEHPAVGARLYYPQPQYSVDNAVGVSVIASSSYD